jgi:hypothetical protein
MEYAGGETGQTACFRGIQQEPGLPAQVVLAPRKFAEAKLRVKTSNVCISAPRRARAILTAHLNAQQGQVSNESQ